ncbi:helix-turn-helix domain-containing protein [Hymenobacter sp. B81]|uniref:helix-turn-helix domain-containing protein n=1 Tax=Hymenobacter sp. B81 TaxID=3344878 RepID=UPI0037DCBB06
MACRAQVARLRQLINALALTPAEFSQRLLLSDDRIDDVLSGKKRPSVKLICRIKRAFPSVCSDWLLMGEGQMFNPPSAPLPRPQESTTTAANSIGVNYGHATQIIVNDSEGGPGLTRIYEAFYTTQLRDKERIIQLLLQQLEPHRRPKP